MRLKTATWLAAGVLGAGALLSGGAAHAQLGTLQKPISLGVRAGGYFPGSRPDGVGKDWLALGADVRINSSMVPVVGGQTISLDYLKKGDSNITGVTLVQMFSSPISAPLGPGGMRPYFGMGFGYYRVHVTSATGDDTKSGAGLKFLAGVDIGQGLYVQGDYHVPATGRVAGMKPTGFALTAGLRF